jgi:hypothetical protein
MPPVASPTDAPSCVAVLRRALKPMRQPLMVYSVRLGSTSANYPFGRETFTRREDAERFIEEMRKEEPDRASSLRIEEHELEAGGMN